MRNNEFWVVAYEKVIKNWRSIWIVRDVARYLYLITDKYGNWALGGGWKGLGALLRGADTEDRFLVSKRTINVKTCNVRAKFDMVGLI